MNNTARPVFNSVYDRFHGYQILINDIEKANIHQGDYLYYPHNHQWELTVYYDITDHFGLDNYDVKTYQGYWFGDVGKGFVAWWRLQHRFQKHPFKTKIYFSVKITGDLDN